MITITIDGKQIQTEEGTSVLKAALQNNIYIPHICHHPDLKDISACKLCYVQVEGQDKPVTSCMLKAEDGMNIVTINEEIQHLRNVAMELILAVHPEDCSTCPKYGNCELQNLIQYMGVSSARMRTRVKGFACETENPLYDHDMNRCILCGRCVRACNDLREVKVLQYKKKGMETYIGTLHEKLLEDANCRFCGACAEVCPTGTIRDKINYPATERKEKLVPCRSTCPANTDVPRYIRFVKEGKYDEALALFNSADLDLLGNEERDDCTYQLATCYLKTDNLREAAIWFETLRANSPKYAKDCDYNLSYIRYTQKRYTDALKRFLPLQADSTYKALVPYYIAEIYTQLKNYDKAQIVAQNYLSAYPNNEHAAEMYRILRCLLPFRTISPSRRSIQQLLE